MAVNRYVVVKLLRGEKPLRVVKLINSPLGNIKWVK